MTRRRDERAAAGVAAVLCSVALCAPLAAGASRVGAVAHGRARLDAVADLAALAAVTGGPQAAAAVARANGAALRSSTEEVDGTVVVVVAGAGGDTAAAAAAPA